MLENTEKLHVICFEKGLWIFIFGFFFLLKIAEPDLKNRRKLLRQWSATGDGYEECGGEHKSENNAYLCYLLFLISLLVTARSSLTNKSICSE